MAKTKDKIKNIIKRLLIALEENGINISEAYLFGSYSDGTSTKNSDIDIALISNEFTGILYIDIKKIGRIVRNIDYRIETHTFNNSDKDNSLFLQDIIKRGKKIA